MINVYVNSQNIDQTKYNTVIYTIYSLPINQPLITIKT